jgi:hypothetical protein
LAILAKISTAFKNTISECLRFQPLMAAENGGASCPAGAGADGPSVAIPATELENAASEDKGRVFAPGSGSPSLPRFHEPDAEAILVTAYLGKKIGASVQGYAYQLRRRPGIKRLLKKATGSGYLARRRAGACQRENQAYGLTHRLQTLHPLAQLLLTHFWRLAQPEVVTGKVEAAGAARYTATLGNALDEFVLAQGLPDLPAEGMEIGCGLAQVIEYLSQGLEIYSGLVSDTVERAPVSVQLFQQLGLHICPCGDREYVQDPFDCRPRHPGVLPGEETGDFPEQMLETQEGADPFVQGVLEGKLCGHDRFPG